MNSLHPKVVIIGVGSLSSTNAFALMTTAWPEKLFSLIIGLRAKGECMDLNIGLSFTYPAKLYASGFEGCKDKIVCFFCFFNEAILN